MLRIGVILHTLIEIRDTMDIALTAGEVHSHPIEEREKGMGRGEYIWEWDGMEGEKLGGRGQISLVETGRRGKRGKLGYLRSKMELKGG